MYKSADRHTGLLLVFRVQTNEMCPERILVYRNNLRYDILQTVLACCLHIMLFPAEINVVVSVLLLQLWRSCHVSSSVKFVVGICNLVLCFVIWNCFL